MSLMRGLVTIPASTAIPADAVVNSWHFDLQIAYAAGLPAIETALKNFYDGWSGYRSNLVSWSTARVKWYDLADPKPRSPVRDATVGMSGTVQPNTLPPELCLCVSYQGVRVSGSKQARRRGRIYCGPLSNGAQTSSTGRPAAALLTALQTSANGLRTASGATTDWSWVAVSTVVNPAGTMTEVSDGWIDDAFDIQRRRGVAASSRLTF